MNEPLHRQMTGGDWTRLIALSVLMGAAFFLTKVALAELPPFTVVFGRVAPAALILILVIYAKGLQFPIDRRLWLAFLVMGLLNNVVPFGLLVWAQTHIASGLAAILNATTPLFTVVLAHVLTRDERLSRGRLVGVAFGFAGVVVLIGPSALGDVGLDAAAELVCLLAAVMYAYAGIFGRRFAGTPLLVVAGGQAIASALLQLPLMLVVDRPWHLPMPGPVTWGAIAGLSILGTALAYVLYFRLLATAGATNLLLVTLLIPVSTMLLEFLFLGANVTPRQLAGLTLIGLGLAAIDGRPWRMLRSVRVTL